MFNNTVTLFNILKNGNNIVYQKTLLNDVFFYKTNQIIESNKGIENTNKIHVIIPNKMLNNFLIKSEFDKLEDKSGNYTLWPKDIIVLGKFENIKSITELQNSNCEYFIISSVSDNRYGDLELQNIEVTN